MSTQQLDYSAGKFVLTALPEATPAQKPYRPGTGNSGGSGSGIAEVTRDIIMESGEAGSSVAVPGPERTVPVQPAFRAYHQLSRDTLFYITGKNERRALDLPAGTSILLREPRGINQYDPVMARYKNQFYIITTTAFQPTSYDSLVYLGKYFMAWQQINGKTRAGVILADGSPVIPLQYDSLYAGIPFFDFVDKNPGGKSNYQPTLKEADSKYNYEKKNPYLRAMTDKFTVFSNGKCGVITLKGDTIIPIAYQSIAQNNLGHSRPREDEFIQLRQNDRYGLTILKYNTEKKRPEMTATIAPVFTQIPGFYYPNYYGIPGYRLVGLYNAQFVFKGYADPTGKEYFE